MNRGPSTPTGSSRSRAAAMGPQGRCRIDAQPRAQHSWLGPRIPPECHGSPIPWQGADAFQRRSVTSGHLVPSSLPTGAVAALSPELQARRRDRQRAPDTTAWGQGAQDTEQPPGSVPVLAASQCPQSSRPLSREAQVPTCLALGPHKALRTVASKGPGEVPAGPAILARLRLALVDIWGAVGGEAPAQDRDRQQGTGGLERHCLSRRAQTLRLLPQAHQPGTALLLRLLAARCSTPVPVQGLKQELGMGTWARGHLGTAGSAGLCQEVPQGACSTSPPLAPFRHPAFSHHCPLPGPGEPGWSRLPQSPISPVLPTTPFNQHLHRTTTTCVQRSRSTAWPKMCDLKLLFPPALGQ